MPARVACVQLAAREISEHDDALREALEMTRDAAARADIVVLPEAVYPGYVVHDPAAVRDLPDGWYERALAAFADVATASGAHVCAGLVRPHHGGLRNSAVLIAPDGATFGCDKCFLWHFDGRWFGAGAPSSVVRTRFGGVGMIVCADARMMELPRRLALGGAALLLDPTGLVLGPAGTNAQIEYMLAARAMENGVFLAVANRCGAEAGIARYAGRSSIFAPDGSRLAEAGPDEPDVIVADVDASAAPGPRGRDPGGYPDLVRPTEELPIARVLAEPPPARGLRVAILAAGADPRAVAELGADLAVGPGRRIGGVGAAHGALHEASGIVLGTLVGERGLPPEEGRAVMLRGASAIVWFVGGSPPPIEIVRTRADENRICVLTVSDDGRWTAVAPSGAVIGTGPASGIATSFVELPVQLSWSKEMVPGTDVVGGRRPDLWPELARTGVDQDPDRAGSTAPAGRSTDADATVTTAATTTNGSV